MKFIKKSLSMVLFASFIFGFNSVSANANNCGNLKNVSVANMTWQSAEFLAELTKTILDKGYGCNVEVVPGDTVPTAAGMVSKGKPDIAPEMWTSSVGEVVRNAIDEGKLIEVSNTFSNNGFEAFWIPSYTAEKYPDLKSVDDLKKYSHLFVEPASNGKGRIYGCPPGWACEIYTVNLHKAYGLEEKFEIFSPGSGNNLKASIARAVKRKKDIVAYYWDPTAVIGQFGLVPLKTEAFDETKWACVSQIDCENPQRTGFAASPVKVLITEKLQKGAPAVSEFLAKLTIENKLMSSILAWAEQNSADSEESVNYFLKNETVWKNWVPQEVSNKISASL